MGTPLIICGWSIDFACTAALILIKYPNADIEASSRQNLPFLLEKLAREPNEKYQQIMIAGVPLNGYEERLKKVFNKLKRQGLEVVWFSSYPVPRQCPESIIKLLTVPRLSDGELLCREVAIHLGIQKSQFKPIEQIAEQSRAQVKSSDAIQNKIDLIEAGMSRYRRFQDMGSFREAVRLISGNRDPGDTEMRIIEEYRSFGKRELRGTSNALHKITAIARTVGKEGNCGVLITGETGTGKETVANLIHGWSPRATEPFIAFNCADLSPQLLESRLFGHEKGAFTGASETRHGAFETADGGTLFLDEVGELPLMAQAGLLRVLQEGRFFRLGGQKEIRSDVRIISATNRKLPEMVSAGTFREDLYYRLNVIQIHVPPLRDRLEDITPIANSYLLGKNRKPLSEAQSAVLCQYHWPGNIRELQNFLDRAMILNTWNFDQLLLEYRDSFSTHSIAVDDRLENVIRTHVISVYRKNNENGAHTAKALGISYNTMKKYLTAEVSI